MRCLVTTGPTREKIDQVRDWGNIFTGNTGLAIARALAAVSDVDLLTSNQGHLAALQSESFPHRLTPASFTTHADLKAALTERMSRQTYDAVFMTAAVADYVPVSVYSVIKRAGRWPRGEVWHVRSIEGPKIKSTHPAIAVLGQQTEKLIDLFRTTWNHRGLLVKFKLEVGLSKDQLIEVAQASRQHSGADYLVANTLDMVSGPNAGAYLLSDSGHEWIARSDLPARMVDLVRTNAC